MNKNIFILFLVFTLFCDSSCNREDADIVIAEISLSEELNLAFREQFREDASADIVVKITTTSEYTCDKGILRTTLVKTDNNEILLNVIGLDFTETADCLGEDVAKSEINLGDLPIGVEFKLQILLLGELKTSGKITNNLNSINIYLPDAGDNTIQVDQSIVTKLPTNTVWGFIDRQNSIADSIVQSFINEMESQGSPLENPSVYGNFEIDFAGNTFVNDFELEGRTIRQDGFAMRFEDDFASLEEFVQTQFCANAYRIRIWDTSGNNISCN